MNPKKLVEVIQSHKLWLDNDDAGERANLRWANLSRADLRGTGVIQINFSRWTMTISATDVFIGCEQISRDEDAIATLERLATKYNATDLLPEYIAALQAIEYIEAARGQENSGDE